MTRASRARFVFPFVSVIYKFRLEQLKVYFKRSRRLQNNRCAADVTRPNEILRFISRNSTAINGKKSPKFDKFVSISRPTLYNDRNARSKLCTILWNYGRRIRTWYIYSELKGTKISTFDWFYSKELSYEREKNELAKDG